MYRSAQDHECAEMTDLDKSTLHVAASMTVSPDYEFHQARYVINATRDFILSGHAMALASERLILSAGLDVWNDPEVLHALADLRKEKVQLAMTVKDEDLPRMDKLWGELDLVEVPWPIYESRADWEWLKSKNSLLLVSRIESHKQAEQALHAGADLLQGFYFQRPKNYTAKSLSAVMVNRLKILQMLESENLEIQELSRAVEGDVGITHRLLTFVNSAAFSLVRRIDSVGHALSLVGLKRLKNWLHLIVICDSLPSEQTQELAYASSVRAKFLELMALNSGRRDIADQLYLLGLFSMLDTLLHQPFQEIFRQMRLHDHIESALLHGTGPLYPWLHLVQVLESGNWNHLDSIASKLGVTVRLISKCKLDAMQWARNFFLLVQ